ncbi:hypothetical protein IWQ60_005050 [Tieghemiomyces parasiticus]|uniref:BD-FAE-like domain-containing protein n=1 Tax=Tieghemiomyces parasiticus TaxID=78921 RepID=A0A9W8A6S2_9FUNG|nr:hypothetical protein IWQ60_005050 [Tieghemiomyces parasiticus]
MEHEPYSRQPHGYWLSRLTERFFSLAVAAQVVYNVGRTALQWFLYLTVGTLLLPFSFPILCSAYLFAWYMYFKLGLLHGPDGFHPLALPWNPVRVLKMSYAALDNLSDLFSGPFPIVLRWIVEKAFARRTPAEAVIRDVRYGAAHPRMVLDMYIPELIAGSPPSSTGPSPVPSVAFSRPASRTSLHLLPDRGPGESMGLPHPTRLSPVICFVYGKTWSSAQRKVYVPMAHTLRKQGYMVALPEARRPPNGTIADTVGDTLQCLLWLNRNVAKYGGDPTSLYLMGHGAGAHLCTLAATVWTLALSKLPAPWEVACPPTSASSLATTTNASANQPRHRVGRHLGSTSSAQARPGSPEGGRPSLQDDLYQLIRHYTLLVRDSREAVVIPRTDTPLTIAGLILLAGVYDIDAQHRYEQHRGIDEISATTRLIGSGSSALYSPPVLLETHCHTAQVTLSQSAFPKKVLLIHGERDTVVPLKSSEQFFDLLCQLDVDDVNLKVYSRTKSMNPAITLLTESASLCQSVLEDIQSTICDHGEA